MNEVIRTIYDRRSVRSFTTEPIERDIIEQIVECGRRAPNAWGNQSFEFFAVTNRKIICDLAQITARYLGGTAQEHDFFSAPLIILIADLRDNFMRLADAGCAMENMFLAAKSYGVGSVWINQLSPICDKLDVIEMLESIGVAKNRVITSIGAFGWPAEPPLPKELISRVHYLD